MSEEKKEVVVEENAVAVRPQGTVAKRYNDEYIRQQIELLSNVFHQSNPIAAAEKFEVVVDGDKKIMRKRENPLSIQMELGSMVGTVYQRTLGQNILRDSREKDPMQMSPMETKVFLEQNYLAPEVKECLDWD